MHAFAYIGFRNILFWRTRVLYLNIQYECLEVFEREPKEKNPVVSLPREVGNHQMEPETIENIR